MGESEHARERKMQINKLVAFFLYFETWVPYHRVCSLNNVFQLVSYIFNRGENSINFHYIYLAGGRYILLCKNKTNHLT